MTVSQELKDAFWDELERQDSKGFVYVNREALFIEGSVDVGEIIAAILRAAQDQNAKVGGEGK